MNKYKYKTRSESDLIVFMLDGEKVNLAGGSVEVTLPSTKKRPPQKSVIRGITDEDVEKLLANPAKYGDWSKKFIDTKTGFTVDFVKPVKGTLKEVKKSPAADKKSETKKVEDKAGGAVKSKPAQKQDPKTDKK